MGKKVMDRRVSLLKLLSDVELNVLNEVLNGRLDEGLNNNGRVMLSAMELEVMTNLEARHIVSYFNVEDEDHSELDRVKLTVGVLGKLVVLEIEYEWFDVIVTNKQSGYWYLTDGEYLEIDPDAAWEILDNKRENWEGK